LVRIGRNECLWGMVSGCWFGDWRLEGFERDGGRVDDIGLDRIMDSIKRFGMEFKTWLW
jgi:hypothetical protein